MSVIAFDVYNELFCRRLYTLCNDVLPYCEIFLVVFFLLETLLRELQLHITHVNAVLYTTVSLELFPCSNVWHPPLGILFLN